MIQASTALILVAHTMTPDEAATLQQAHELVGIVSGLVGVLMVTVVAALVALVRRLNRIEDGLIELRGEVKLQGQRVDDHLVAERDHRAGR